MASRACLTSCSVVMSSLATPMIGQSSSPRRSSRYSARNVIRRARSPVMPKMTSTSAASSRWLSISPPSSGPAGPRPGPGGTPRRASARPGPRPRRPAPLLVAEAGHAEGGHPAGLGRPHADGRVLDHETPGGRGGQFFGRHQEDHRIRLAARQVAPGNVRVQQVEQGEALFGDVGIQRDLPQEEVGVLGRGRGGDRDAGRLHREDKPDRVRNAVKSPASISLTRCSCLTAA